MPRTTEDLTGRRFGRLEVLERAPRDGTTPHAQWTCKCECGNTAAIGSYALRSGSTKSCGCIRPRSVKRTGHKPVRTPGYKGAYYTWYAMIARTTNPNHPAWENYGGRGITVCERWRSFENFLADMGERPPGLTLERENNNGNYEAGNCHWATKREQARNRRNVKLTPQRLCQLMALSEAGVPTDEIARQVDLSYKTTTLAIWIVDTLRELHPGAF